MCKILSHAFAWNYVNTGGDAIVLFNTLFERTVFFNLPCNFCDSSRGLTRKNELMNGGYVSMGIFDSRVLSVTTDCKVLPQHCDCWRCWGTKEISNFEKKKKEKEKKGKKKDVPIRSLYPNSVFRITEYFRGSEIHFEQKKKKKVEICLTNRA